MADVNGFALSGVVDALYSSENERSLDGHVVSLDPQPQGTLTLREALTAGLAKIVGHLEKYPLVVCERALELEDVDLDATKVIFLE